MSSFLIRLHELLDQKSYPKVLKWSEDGQSFHFVDKDLFMTTVNSKEHLCKAEKFSSIQTKLREYGFENKGDNEWKNAKFIRGKSTPVKEIEKKKKETKEEEESPKKHKREEVADDESVKKKAKTSSGNSGKKLQKIIKMLANVSNVLSSSLKEIESIDKDE